MTEIFIILVLILFNGIFSMSEIALVSSRKFKLENAARKGNKNARKALDLAASPNTFLSTVQIGITLIGILTGIYSGQNITDDLEAAIVQIPALAEYSHSIAVTLVLIAITFLSIVFGELIPKRIGLAYPEAIASAVARPMSWLSKIALPFIWLLTRTNDLFLRLFGIKPTLESKVTEEEIKSIIQESAEGGEIQEIEQDIVQRVFALGDRRVSALMTHRSDLVWIDVNDSLEEIRTKMQSEPHSVYPVADGELDQVLGVLSIKDILFVPLDKFNIRDYIKDAFFISEHTAAYNLLEQFKANKLHYALLVDEYGTLQGLITMDDMLDALVGDMTAEEHDEYGIVQRDENSWLADAQYPFFEFLNYFEIEYNEEHGHFNTLGGFIIDRMNKIPHTGEKLTWGNFEFEVVDKDGSRLDKLMITMKPEEKE